MASVEKLYCGTTTCTENDVRTEYGAYCRKKKDRQITSKKTLKLPNTTSQIDTKFLPGYKIEEIGGLRGLKGPLGYGCGYKTVYTKNKDWEGWNAPGTPGAPGIAGAPAPPVQTGGLASAPLEAKILYLTPEKLYCGVKKCSDDHEAVGKYCKLPRDGSVMGSIKTPASDTISTEYLPGYKMEEKGQTCEFYQQYTKIPDWPGWTLSSTLMNQYYKCCTTLSSLQSADKTKCGSYNKGQPLCNNLIEKKTLTPDAVYCGTRECSLDDTQSNLIRRYCRGWLPPYNITGVYTTLKTPGSDLIDPRYLAGYVSTEIGAGCERRQRHYKNPNHEVWKT